MFSPSSVLSKESRHFVVYDDPYDKDASVTDEFLIPFAGTFSQWCLGFCTEWTIEEKDCLALMLMDAMLDFEQRGIYTIDLKTPNILLTTEGLKIIDLDLETHTLGYSRWGIWSGSAVHALYNMAMAMQEFFLFGTPYAIRCEEAIPKPFIQLIDWCLEDAFGSVAEMMAKTASMLEPTRG